MKENSYCSIFNALSNETRLQIFRILVEHSKKGITPTEISALMNDMPRNTLSFHLTLLANAKLCESTKQGKQVIYTPNCEKIREVTSFLLRDCCEGECKC